MYLRVNLFCCERGKNMNSKLGETLRMVRKGKGISICKLADWNLSKSQISRFERGESEISCIRLINLLNKLKMTLEEFLTIHDRIHDETHSTSEFFRLVNYVRKEYNSDHIKNLKLLISNPSSYGVSSLEKVMLKSIIFTVDENYKPSDKELLLLTDYLFRVEVWGYYEIILLSNCVRTLNYDSLFLLTKEMLKNYYYSNFNKTNKTLVTQLAINCLIASTDHNKFNHCKFLIHKIKELLNDELNFYEKTVFLYAEGHFQYKNNMVDGKTKMLHSLKVFEILNEKSLYSHYFEHYKSHVLT